MAQGPSCIISAIFVQLARVDDGIMLLRERALDITNLMSYVSLNMAAVRKILKKIAKKIHSDGPHGPGDVLLCEPCARMQSLRQPSAPCLLLAYHVSDVGIETSR